MKFMNNEKSILIILDGWGHGPNPEVSAIAQANTPFVDSLYKKYPNSELITHGKDVGLPAGQMGNSEVGHLNIGAGRVVYQELAKINKAIEDGTFHSNPTLIKSLRYAKGHNKSVHLIGLLSDGGVHSHINHLKALCDITQGQSLQNVFIHAFTDGRDVDPKSGIRFVKEILNHTKNQRITLASIIGRYYSMDRDKRWERIKLAYDLMVKGEGKASSDILKSIEESYAEGTTDEFIRPIVKVNEKGRPITKIREDDVVIFFNFRTDRPREITTVLTQKDMSEFGMKKLKLHYVTMTSYDETFENVEVLFEKNNLNYTLGEIISKAGKSQVRIAETEKYPHVTFFFSGGRELKFEGEKRIMIPSPKVATYDFQPEMSAFEVTDAIINEIMENQPDFICLNFANTDMVGHTGVFEAAKKAAEVVDSCLEKLISVVLQFHYQAIVIADHGNSDYMINDDGTPNTAHTKNPVPCFYISENQTGEKLRDGRLADVAPTLLAMMNLECPEEMDGNCLIYKEKQTV
jgi:2,3-bisphosphoglycerate-independent phosphoglycerate mutase